MNIKQKSRMFIAMSITLCTIFSVSCTNEDSYENQSLPNLSKKSLTINNPTLDNYLTFGDFDQLEQKVIELDEMTEDEISNWEKSKNFVSIRTISDAIDSAEFDFYEHVKDSLLKLYTESEIENMKFPEMHAQLFYEFSELFIKKTMKDDNSIYYDLDINNYNYSRIVNKDGIVKVGTPIYQFKEATIKIIEDGNKDKIKILDDIIETDPINKITVINLKGDNLFPPNNMNVTPHPFEYETYKTRNTFKVIMRNRFEQKYYSPRKCYATTYSIQVRSLRRYFGVYGNYKTNMTYNGSFTGSSHDFGYWLDHTNPYNLKPRYALRDWSLSNQYRTKKTNTLYYYFFTNGGQGDIYTTFQRECFFSTPYTGQPYDLEISGGSIYATLGQYSLPEIYHWNHSINVQGSSQISFSTTH